MPTALPSNAPASGEVLAGRYVLDLRLPSLHPGEAWAADDREAPAAQRSVVVSLLGHGAVGRDDDPTSLAHLVARQRRLDEAGLCALRACGDAFGRRFVVYERSPGRTLADWLEGHQQAGTRPSLAAAIHVFDRLLATLQVLHPAGLVHGALGPRNVWIRRLAATHRQVRVSHVGLVPFLARATGTAQMHPADPTFLAPEQVPGVGQESTRADVFALAALWTELTARPQTRRDGVSWWLRAKEGDGAVREALAARCDEVPSDVREVFATALQADPARRPEDAGALRRSLRHAWKRAGLWDKAPPADEPEPPEVAPRAVPEPRPTPPTRAAAAQVPVGWQTSARASVPSAHGGHGEVARVAPRASPSPLPHPSLLEPEGAPEATELVAPTLPLTSPDDEAPSTIPMGVRSFFFEEKTEVERRAVEPVAAVAEPLAPVEPSFDTERVRPGELLGLADSPMTLPLDAQALHDVLAGSASVAAGAGDEVTTYVSGPRPRRNEPTAASLPDVLPTSLAIPLPPERPAAATPPQEVPSEDDTEVLSRSALAPRARDLRPLIVVGVCAVAALTLLAMAFVGSR